MDADGATIPTEAEDEIRGHLNWSCGSVGKGTTWKPEIWITIIVGLCAILKGRAPYERAQADYYSRTVLQGTVKTRWRSSRYAVERYFQAGRKVPAHQNRSR